MATNQVGIYCLREDVRWVILAGPFPQGEIPGAHALLHPQLPHCEVPDSPNAGAATDSDGRAAVCQTSREAEKP
eukprot:4904401-Alexandrium_andersonii.AAC.1